MDLGDHVHAQNFASRLLLELVRAVAGADGDGQCIATGLLDEIASFNRVGEVVFRLFFREASTLSVLDATQAAKFGLDGHTSGVREVDYLFRDADL